MRYRNDILINAAPEIVWQVFDDPESSYDWQPALKSHSLIAGNEGEVGSVYELVYDNDGKELKVVATLTEKRKLESVASTVDCDAYSAKVYNWFQAVGDEQTRWTFDIEYRFKGVYWLVSLFLRSTMRARAADEMQRFRQLVESRSSS